MNQAETALQKNLKKVAFQSIVNNLVEELERNVKLKSAEHAVNNLNTELTDAQILAHARTFFTQQLAEAMNKQLKDACERQNSNQ